MSKTPFAILRVEKIHTRRQLRDASKHNDRTAKDGLDHVEIESADNTPIIGDPDVVKTWDTKMAEKGLARKKQRKDGVVALEWVATASPEFFTTATPEQRTKWAQESVAFIIEQAGGMDNVLAVYLHEDEKTPHIHALTIPLVEKERRRQGRPRKGREAAPRAAQKAWALSAADIIGGSSHRLNALQDHYAEAVADTGLRRGIPRKETGARNRSPAHWRAEQARLADEAQKALNEVQAGVSQVAQTNEWIQGLGRVVADDAKRVGVAIQFPDYIKDPKAATARRAVGIAVAAAQKPPPQIFRTPEQVAQQFAAMMDPQTIQAAQAAKEALRRDSEVFHSQQPPTKRKGQQGNESR